MAPDHEIRILDKESTKDIQNFKRSSDSIQRYSDFVRLDRLSKYGGVWIDASVYLTKPLDWIQDGSDFVGYKYDSSIQSNADLPLVVSYFFACKKGSKYLQDWYEEFKLFDTFDTVNDYLNSLEIDYSKVKGPEYLTVYISSMVVRSKNNYENMNLCSIEKETSFNIQDFCDDNIDPEIRLIKIDNTQRTYLEKIKCNKISV
jgi:mannosyltransferase OCH1-like enzyme